MKRIAFIGANPNGSSFKRNTDEAFSVSGNNTGNYAFWNAVDRQILGDKEYIEGWNFNPEKIQCEFDLVVLPASNFIHPDRDMGGLADKLEKVNLPVLVVGLGAQAAHKNEGVRFKKGTVRFAKVLSDLATKIAVRGEYTAAVLESFGINNVEVIGCPSNFTNLDPELGVKNENSLSELRNTPEENISILVNIDAHRKKFKGAFKKFHSSIKNNPFQIVCQNPFELVSLARGEVYDEANHHMTHQADLWCSGESREVFERFAKERFITFFNAEAWMEYARKFELSIGTRLHGNMLAFQSYVPSFFVSHDSRTNELVDIMMLPRCDWDDFTGGQVHKIIEKCEFSGRNYDQNRRYLAASYQVLLDSYGVPISRELREFVG
ncbi:polysaccharide pyruvyl transferase family protein [Microbulbifer variabilis]|uniref:polysaccharide pyruvyl transferase family protein n=1 Tax=Microbulbifer variabilis TaxID=266805 RepID=UPI00037CB382|nr:polysaccharide pyruvyl transferase family protein [Microbulbifer variabilis]